MSRSPGRLLVGLVCVLALSACGPGNPTDPKEPPHMTPDRAYASMEKTLTALAEAAAPDGRARLADPDRKIPCGGLEGTSFSKIQGGLEGGPAAKVTDLAGSIAKARAKAVALGYDVEDNEPGSPKGFHLKGKGFVVGLLMQEDDVMLFLGETDCLDNPDR